MMINVVFVEHTKGGKLFLFKVPGSTLLPKGALVSVQPDRADRAMGWTACRNFFTPEDTCRVMARACGGYWPLAQVTGVCHEEALV